MMILKIKLLTVTMKVIMKQLQMKSLCTTIWKPMNSYILLNYLLVINQEYKEPDQKQ